MGKLLTLFSVLFTQLVWAQRNDGTSVMPIMQTAATAIEKIENSNNEIVRIEFDILKDEKSSYRSLYSQWNYGILAFGESDRVEDIDIELYRQTGDSWTLVKKDTDVASVASMTFKPVYDGNYKIVIKGYRFSSGGSHYGLIIFHE